MNYYGIPNKSEYLSHAGKKGMKWGYTDGVRNGKRTAEDIEKELADVEREIAKINNDNSHRYTVRDLDRAHDKKHKLENERDIARKYRDNKGNLTESGVEKTIGDLKKEYDRTERFEYDRKTDTFYDREEKMAYTRNVYNSLRDDLYSSINSYEKKLKDMQYMRSPEYKINKAKEKAREILDKIKDTSVKAVSATKESISKAKEIVDNLIRRVKSDIASNRSTDSRKEPNATYTGSYITKGSDGKLRTVNYESKKKIKKKKLPKTLASRGYQFTLGPNGQTVVTRN